MTASSPRLALAHGPEGFAVEVSAALAGVGLAVSGAPEARAFLEALASVERPAVALVDAGSLPALGAGLPSSPPVVVLSCADAVGASDALARGAAIALRRGASPAEVAAAVRLCVEAGDARRDRDLAREDLERHRALAVKDDLTAAYNRRFFERHLDEELQRARRTSAPLSLVFMDVDNLKEVNRRYGHPTGSEVLKEAAARTMRSVRASDFVVRYGGDEFCIILPNADAARALEVAERVRAAIADDAFVVDGTGPVRLTASFGIAAWPEHASDRRGLVRAADNAMVRSKEERRNGIRVSQEQPA